MLFPTERCLAGCTDPGAEHLCHVYVFEPDHLYVVPIGMKKACQDGAWRRVSDRQHSRTACTLYLHALLLAYEHH